MVEPPERFSFRWPAAPGSPVTPLVTFTLETVPEGTQVTVTEAGFEGLPEAQRRPRFELNDEGWRIQLASIATYVQEMADD